LPLSSGYDFNGRGVTAISIVASRPYSCLHLLFSG
jgi:hypothetical protein